MKFHSSIFILGLLISGCAVTKKDGRFKIDKEATTLNLLEIWIPHRNTIDDKIQESKFNNQYPR
jgi:hypothetical protein